MGVADPLAVAAAAEMLRQEGAPEGARRKLGALADLALRTAELLPPVGCAAALAGATRDSVAADRDAALAAARAALQTAGDGAADVERVAGVLVSPLLLGASASGAGGGLTVVRAGARLGAAAVSGAKRPLLFALYKCVHDKDSTTSAAAVSRARGRDRHARELGSATPLSAAAGAPTVSALHSILLNKGTTIKENQAHCPAVTF
jgi:hypothetical protein